MIFLSKSFAISTTYPKIVTNGLVLNLDAGQQNSYPGSGTTWTDLSGRGNTGTLVNGVGYVGTNGGSLVFNSTGPYIQLNQNSYDITDVYTVSFWVKRISGTGVFLYIGQSSTTGMYFESYTNTDLYTWFFGANSPQNNGNWGANALSTTQWVNVVMTMVTSTKTQTRYLNGTISGSPFVFTNAVTAPSAVSSNWLIKNNSQNWSGYISDLKLYNRALSADEIKQMPHTQGFHMPARGKLIVIGADTVLQPHAPELDQKGGQRHQRLQMLTRTAHKLAIHPRNALSPRLGPKLWPPQIDKLVRRAGSQ